MWVREGGRWERESTKKERGKIPNSMKKIILK